MTNFPTRDFSSFELFRGLAVDFDVVVNVVAVVDVSVIVVAASSRQDFIANLVDEEKCLNRIATSSKKLTSLEAADSDNDDDDDVTDAVAISHHQLEI